MLMCLEQNYSKIVTCMESHRTSKSSNLKYSSRHTSMFLIEKNIY